MEVKLKDKDFLEENYFVFKDELKLSNVDKSMIEGSVLDHLTEDKTTFAVSIGDFSLLTAEKKTYPNGTKYVLIRKSSQKEKNDFYQNDDEDEEISYVNPAFPDSITREDVHKALQFLLAVEPEEGEVNSQGEYELATAEYKEQIDMAMNTIKEFAKQIEPKTLENMRDIYYSFTNDPDYLQTSASSSVVTYAINNSWHGIGPWQK